jgi:hypothetical protein
MKKTLKSALVGVFIASLNACSAHHDLIAPCHHYGRYCSQEPINTLMGPELPQP